MAAAANCFASLLVRPCLMNSIGSVLVSNLFSHDHLHAPESKQCRLLEGFVTDHTLPAGAWWSRVNCAITGRHRRVQRVWVLVDTPMHSTRKRRTFSSKQQASIDTLLHVRLQILMPICSRLVQGLWLAHMLISYTTEVDAV